MVERSPRSLRSVLAWFDSSAAKIDESADRRGIDPWRIIPYIGMHLACLGVIWVGWSPQAVTVAVALYAVRMLAITGFYHRYFSHRTFRTSRVLQFIFAVIGASAVQRGPIWWAAHHRHHHAVTELPPDPHSPVEHGLAWSHSGWFLANENYHVREDRVRDLMRYPELRLLDRYDILVPVALAVALLLAGGAQMLIWGFFISTVALYHGTFTINSLAHHWGSRRYATTDNSRNNFWLALITFGEGWHNNHHHFPASVRQGFYWWEIDLTYYVLRGLAAIGLVWDLRPVPLARREAWRIS